MTWYDNVPVTRYTYQSCKFVEKRDFEQDSTFAIWSQSQSSKFNDKAEFLTLSKLHFCSRFEQERTKLFWCLAEGAKIKRND